MPRQLTEREQRFVEAYLVSRNASRAARDAGHSPARARSCLGVRCVTSRRPLYVAGSASISRSLQQRASWIAMRRV